MPRIRRTVSGTVASVSAPESVVAREPASARLEEPRTDRVAYAALVVTATCFGGTWVAGSVAVDALPPFTIAAVRFALASVLLWAGARLGGRRLSSARMADLPLIAGLGLTAVAGYNFLFLTGLSLAPATDGSLIVPGLSPIVTALVAVPVLGERLRRATVAGLLLAIVGLVLVVNPQGGTSGERLIGDLCFLGGAVLWGIYSVLSRIGGARFDSLSATLYGTAAGTVILLPLALLEGGISRLARADVGAWLGIGYLAVFGTVVGFVLLQFGIRRIGASRATAFALLVPVVGVSTSAWLLAEPIGPLTVVGAAIILSGLWLVERPGAH